MRMCQCHILQVFHNVDPNCRPSDCSGEASCSLASFAAPRRSMCLYQKYRQHFRVQRASIDPSTAIAYGQPAGSMQFLLLSRQSVKAYTMASCQISNAFCTSLILVQRSWVELADMLPMPEMVCVEMPKSL